MKFEGVNAQLREFCRIHLEESPTRMLDLREVYEKYLEWCAAQEIQEVLGKLRFGAWLDSFGFSRSRRADKVRYSGKFREDCPTYPPYVPPTKEERKARKVREREELLAERERCRDPRPISRYLKKLLKGTHT